MAEASINNNPIEIDRLLSQLKNDVIAIGSAITVINEEGDFLAATKVGANRYKISAGSSLNDFEGDPFEDEHTGSELSRFIHRHFLGEGAQRGGKKSRKNRKSYRKASRKHARKSHRKSTRKGSYRK